MILLFTRYNTRKTLLFTKYVIKKQSWVSSWYNGYGNGLKCSNTSNTIALTFEKIPLGKV